MLYYSVCPSATLELPIEIKVKYDNLNEKTVHINGILYIVSVTHSIINISVILDG